MRRDLVRYFVVVFERGCDARWYGIECDVRWYGTGCSMVWDWMPYVKGLDALCEGIWFDIL